MRSTLVQTEGGVKLDDYIGKYKTMRDAFLRERTTNTILSAENEALAQALRSAEEDWLTPSETWLKEAHNALRGWRARNPI